ncbi:hypothetical protein, partial [Aeromonas dhakensis]|uniref:hypothetical protein n=1 Tax=Aeromonas dhakensis TaxID=196024 RepID=UPI003BA04D9E
EADQGTCLTGSGINHLIILMCVVLTGLGGSPVAAVYRKGRARGSDQRSKSYKNVIKRGAAAYLG